MPTLTSGQKDQIYTELVDQINQTRDPISVITTDLRAAVDSIDTWADDNTVSFNNALPTAAKNGLTAKQKSQLLRYVVKKRQEIFYP